MDVTPYIDEVKIAPRAVFDSLDDRGSRPRFMVPTDDGDWRAVTWKAYAQQIQRIGLYLRNIGVKSGDRCAIYAPNRIEWTSAALGIQAVGGVMVPIYPSCTADQAGYIVSHSDAKVVFVDTPALLGRLFEAWEDCSDLVRVVTFEDIDAAEVLQGLREAGADVPSYAEVEPKLVTWRRAQDVGERLEDEELEAFHNVMENVSLDQPGVMLYTSGTTGRPKGVPLTHRNVGVNGRDWMKCNAPVIADDPVDILWLPMSHAFGFGEACLGNILGFTTYLSDPVRVLDHLPEVKPNVFMSVPRYFEKLAQAALDEPDGERRAKRLADVTGGNLEFCLSGGAGLKREVKELFYESGILIIEGYGLTEASPTLTLNRPDDFRFDTVGKPLPSVEIKIAEDGEILARGENIFGGYHKNPAATKETFTEDGWLKTGDLGRFTDDGFLQIVGRKKEILVTAAGKNISPVPIERRFNDDPHIEHVVMYGDGEKYLVAGVWPNVDAVRAKLGQDASAEEVHAFLQSRVDDVNAQLASYETIKKFNVFEDALTVEDGFLTPTLKVKRNQVYEAYGEQLQALY